MRRGVFERLEHRYVGVREHKLAGVKVLAHHGYVDGSVSVFDLLYKTFPLAQVGLFGRKPQHLAEYVAHAVLFVIERDIVDALDIGSADDALGQNVAEGGYLFFALFVQRHRGAREDDVGLQAHRVQRPCGVLSRLGLHLADVVGDGHVGKHHHRDIARKLLFEHARRLKEDYVLVLAYRAAHLHQRHFRTGGFLRFGNAAYDLQRYVGHHLHVFAFVLKIALAPYDLLIHPAGGHVVDARQGLAQKALVVAHVLVALVAVLEYKHLAVLGRVHRAGIDVDIRVDFYRRCFKAF